MSEDKAELLDELRAEYERWEALLAGLSDAQITTAHADGTSPKGELAHLWAWQQITRARIRGALHDQVPDFPTWPVEIIPGDEGDLEAINAWIQTTYGDQSWARIHADWRAGFQEYIALIEAVSDDALFTPRRFAWLGGYRLADFVLGSYEHHQGHREDLLAHLGVGRAV